MDKNNIFFGRKGDISGRKVIFYIVFSFIAAIVFLLVVYMVTSDKSKITEILPGLEEYLLIQRFLTSPNCFAYQDADSGKVYAWTIDLQKFNENNLNKCYSASDTKVKAFRLSLSYGTLKTAISTKNWEGFLKKGETRQVYIYDRGQIKTGELFIEIQDVK